MRRRGVSQVGMGVRLRVWALAAAVCLLWGSSFVLTKVALSEVGPMAIAFGRWALAAAAFALYLPLMGLWPQVQRALREEGRALAFLALVGIAFFYALQNWGLRFSTAVNVGWVINLTSIFIAILGVWWLGERLDRGAAAGIVIAFAGVSLVSLQGQGVVVGGASWLGDGLTALAALCAAVYSVYGKRIVARHAPLVVTATTAALGALFLLPMALWEGMRWPRSPSVIGALVLLGFGSGALANLWWWRVLAQSDAARAGLFLFFIPIVSTALGVVGLGEPFTWPMAAGAVLVLIGTALAQRRSGGTAAT